MSLYYPRSFPRLLAVGFTLVALPLVFALVNNAISVDRLANRSQNAVYQAAQATQASRRLSQLLGSLERTARQIVILDDRSLLDAYVANRRQFEQAVAEISRLPLETGQQSALDEIVSGEAEIFAALSGAATKGAQLKGAVERFVKLADRAQSIVSSSNAQIDREVEAMRTTADQAQRITFWQLLALIPVVVFLVIGFSILITRPIRQIDAAIRRLGAGQFRVPVTVSGPQDLEQLGERLEWMRRELLDLEEQKNRFLRQVSHELKTPLTALREGAELLSEEAVGKLTAEQREIAEILRHNSVELQKLIEDLLSFGASQFRKVTVDLEPVDIRRSRRARGRRPAVGGEGPRPDARRFRRRCHAARRPGKTARRARQPGVQCHQVLPGGRIHQTCLATRRRHARAGRDRPGAGHPARGARAHLRAVLPRAACRRGAGARDGNRVIRRKGIRFCPRRQRGGCGFPARRAHAHQAAA